MTNVLIGLGLVALGFLITLKSEWMLRNFGRVEWAEKHLGIQGGSRLFYKLIGLLTIIIGLLVTTDLFHGAMETILSPLLPK